MRGRVMLALAWRIDNTQHSLLRLMSVCECVCLVDTCVYTCSQAMREDTHTHTRTQRAVEQCGVIVQAGRWMHLERDRRKPSCLSVSCVFVLCNFMWDMDTHDTYTHRQTVWGSIWTMTPNLTYTHRCTIAHANSRYCERLNHCNRGEIRLPWERRVIVGENDKRNIKMREMEWEGGSEEEECQ